MNLQNSTLEVSASLMMSGTEEKSFGLHSIKLVDWNLKDLTKFPFRNWNFNLKFQVTTEV